jgi:hypothetical protein
VRPDAVREPDDYPVIRLDVSGFKHRNEQIGWVKVPAFTRVGKRRSRTCRWRSPRLPTTWRRDSLVSSPAQMPGSTAFQSGGVDVSLCRCNPQYWRELCRALLSRYGRGARFSRELCTTV